MKRGGFAAAAAIVVLAVPSAASAHKYTVFAGPAVQKLPAGVPKSLELDAFMPGKLKVRAGDKVQYLSTGFHTVSLGAPRPPLAVPAPGETYQGINDPQGNPFFFNGLQKFKYNEVTFAPAGDATIDDRDVHSSGLLLPSQSGPGKYTLTFADPGSYRVLCFIHPGMQQTVKVLKGKAKGAATDAQVTQAISRQQRREFKAAVKAARVKPRAKAAVYAGSQRRHAAIDQFLPGKLTVQAGTTVTFTNRSPAEPHNMVFGDRAFTEPFQRDTDLLPMGPGAPNQVTPGYVYATEPVNAADGSWTYSGTEFGNGFFWSPLMDGSPGDPPAGLPSQERITFDTPGTYTYYCGIHGTSMRGTVTVK